jgi:sulfonate transport system substrate-binding protein
MVAAVETVKRMRSRAPWTLAALTATVVLAACRAQPGRGTHVRLAVGGQTQMVYLPTTLAQELGFYREESLDVDLQDFEGGAKSLQALIGGSADVVSGYYDHTIQMAAEGRELVAFVTMLRYPGLILVSPAQAAPPVASIEMLKGRIVGVTSPGSSSQMFLTYLLKRAGVAADAVSVTAIGAGASAVAATESGRIDAAWLADPAFTIVKKRNPGIRVLADLRTGDGTKQAFGVETYPAAVLYTTGAWLRANRSTAQRLARAIVKTLTWMSTHSEQEIAERVPAAIRGDDLGLYIEALRGSRPMFAIDGTMPAEGAAVVRDVLATFNPKVRNATIDLTMTYTNDLLGPDSPTR